MSVVKRLDKIPPPGFETHKLGPQFIPCITWTGIVHRGIDEFFDGRLVTLEMENIPVPVSKYWEFDFKQDGEARLKCPSGYKWMLAYSRLPFKYPIYTVSTKLPRNIAYPQFIALGLEADGYVGPGSAAFLFSYTEATGHYIYAGAGGDWGIKWVYLPGALPSDFDTKRHNYTIVVLKPWIEFYIDSKLVAIFINSPGSEFDTIDYPPYAIAPAKGFVSPSMLALLEIHGNGSELTWNVHPAWVRVFEGEPLPPRVFRHYVKGTDTTIDSKYTVSSGNIESHPVPVFGYSSKTIYFRASVDGTLRIYVLRQASPNEWSEYDSVSVTSGDLIKYIMTGDAVLLKLIFEPASYPAYADVCEVVMR